MPENATKYTEQRKIFSSQFSCFNFLNIYLKKRAIKNVHLKIKLPARAE